jgi:hypothetical protein
MKPLSLSIICFSALLFFAGCVTSKRITDIQKAPSDSLFTSNVDLSDLETKYSKYDGVYLKIKDIREHSVTKGMYSRSWYYHRIWTKKYMILNPENTKLSTFEIQLSPFAKINSFYLILLSPNGTVERYGQKDLYTEKNSDGSITYKFALPAIMKGTVVEQGIDLTYNGMIVRPPLEYDVELQFELPCEELELEFAYPDWWEIRTKKISKDVDINYVITHNVEENKSILTYKAEYIPPIIPEPFSPYFNDMAKYLSWNFTLIDFGSPIELNKNWLMIAKEYREYAMNKEGFLSTKVGSVTGDLIETCTTPKSKVDTIVSYIQKNIKISDDYKDRSFAQVLNDLQGSIYEICGLTEAMLSKAGFETDYLVIHSAESGYFDQNFISFSQFQIPAIKVKVENDECVVIPYYKYLPIDHIPEIIQEQKALVVSNDDNKNGSFWETPIGEMQNNIFKEKYDLKINLDGSISVAEEKILKGSFAFEVRKHFDELKEKELDDEIRDMLTYTEGSIGPIDYTIENRVDYKVPLVIKINYTINNLITNTPDEILFQTGGLLSPSSRLKTKIDPKDRVNPVVIYYDQTYEKEILIQYPTEWSVVNKLDNIKLANEFGNIEGQYFYSEGILEISQRSHLKKSSEPKQKINDLLKIVGSTTQLELPAIIFSVSNNN